MRTPGDSLRPSEVRLSALELSRDLTATPANILRIAKATSDEAARWAFGQWELRAKARTKFAEADRMLFVREALEQATGEAIARYHASRFPEGAPVVDMTAGVGADLIALARRGPAIGYELDPERAMCAAWNLRVHGVEAEVRVEDSVAALRQLPREFAFADPARQLAGRRTLEPDQFQPSLEELREVLSPCARALIKLSPMLPDAVLEEIGGSVEFLSYGGECREALVFLRATEGFSAVHIETGERLARAEAPYRVEEPGSFLFDADPAAVRADALGSLGADALADSNGYLTADEPIASPWLQAFAVLWAGGFDLKTLRKKLQELHSGTPELKQRGAGLDLISLRKQLRSEGSRQLVVAFYRSGKAIRCAICEPYMPTPV